MGIPCSRFSQLGFSIIGAMFLSYIFPSVLWYAGVNVSVTMCVCVCICEPVKGLEFLDFRGKILICVLLLTRLVIIV